MTENTNAPETKKPSFIAYVVTDRANKDKGIWRDVGVAFEHKDGNGFDLLLAAAPVDGRLVLRIPSPKKS